MKETLQLKHLAPYLSYGLMCELIDQGKIKRAKLCGAYLDNSYAFFDTVESEHGYDSIKPILKPLSDLNSYFLDYNNFEGWQSEWVDHVSDFQEKLHEANILACPYDLMQDLLSKHFDVFGLIDKGLAIPKQ